MPNHSLDRSVDALLPKEQQQNPKYVGVTPDQNALKAAVSTSPQATNEEDTKE